jgi:transposase-like protein
MSKPYQDSTFSTTETAADPLEALARQGARQMLQALEAEVAEHLQRTRYQRGDTPRGYRNGYLPERALTLGSGAVSVKVPRVSDEPDGERFESKLVKPCQKRSQTVEALFPKLFIEGLATRDFEPALCALLGTESALSPSTVSRLNQQFKAEYEAWGKCRLAETKFVYLYADGISLAAGIGDEKACLLIVPGVDTDGRKHFLALGEGYRESKESWLGVLRDLRDRGMNAPALAIGDGALGFWAALGELFPLTKQRLYWLHKTRGRARHAAEEGTPRSGTKAAGDPARVGPRCGGKAGAAVNLRLAQSLPGGSQLFGSESGKAAGLLRLSERAPATPANEQRN